MYGARPSLPLDARDTNELLGDLAGAEQPGITGRAKRPRRRPAKHE